MSLKKSAVALSVIGLALMVVSAVIGTAAAVVERLLQGAVDLKSENDLTV